VVLVALTSQQKSVALVMWARWLGYVSLIFFAFAFTAILGWKRVMPHQIQVGLVGFVFFFWLSQRILRYLPISDTAGPRSTSPDQPSAGSGQE